MHNTMRGVLFIINHCLTIIPTLPSHHNCYSLFLYSIMHYIIPYTITFNYFSNHSQLYIHNATLSIYKSIFWTPEGATCHKPEILTPCLKLPVAIPWGVHGLTNHITIQPWPITVKALSYPVLYIFWYVCMDVSLPIVLPHFNPIN